MKKLKLLSVVLMLSILATSNITSAVVEPKKANTSKLHEGPMMLTEYNSRPSMELKSGGTVIKPEAIQGVMTPPLIASFPDFDTNVLNTKGSVIAELNIDVNSNTNTDILGHELEIYVFTYNYMDPIRTLLHTAEIPTHIFTATDETFPATFTNVKLPYTGLNGIAIYIYDTVSGDYCYAIDQTQTYYAELFVDKLIPVYRFWNLRIGGHFFTASKGEKDSIIEKYPHIWDYEGIAFYVSSLNKGDCIEAIGLDDVYRFWSQQKQHHFYTISEKEKNSIIANYPDYIWAFERSAFCASKPMQFTNQAPVYRFWSDAFQSHFFTINEVSKDKMIAKYPDRIWKYEGVAYFAVK